MANRPFCQNPVWKLYVNNLLNAADFLCAQIDFIIYQFEVLRKE